MKLETCEICGVIWPNTDTERGSESYDEPFGEGTFTKQWERHYTTCCDGDVVMLSDDDIEDSVLGDLPKLVEFGYNIENLRACCTVSFDQKHFNLMLHQLSLNWTDVRPSEWRLTVVHPDILEPHNWRCPKERIHSEAMIYDWITNILEESIKYSSDHFTTYEILLSNEKYTMKIFWVL